VEIELFVPGEPRPWSVYTRQGTPPLGFVRMQEWQLLIQIAAKKAMAGRPPLEGSVRVHVIFSRGIPETVPKVPAKPNKHEHRDHFSERLLKAKLKRDAWLDAHLISPRGGDRDNYLKAFSDALQGIIYHDDSQIIGGDAIKDYVLSSQEGHTWAIIRHEDVV